MVESSQYCIFQRADSLRTDQSALESTGLQSLVRFEAALRYIFRVNLFLKGGSV